MDNHFYITTTLPYVNAEPHIGFALEIIEADVVARYHRLLGKDVIFNTGTDEHGKKIYQKALEQERDVQEYVDEYAAKFHYLKQTLDLSYDRFIRTTDPNHIAAAQAFWKRCEENGDIYKAQYQTKYCVGCELAKTDSELENGHCAVHPNLEIELRDEENYFFRFSKYQQPLLDFYDKNPNFVVPSHRLKEIRNFVEGGLQDFSISRLKESMPWGVPVPGDEDHVMYVWFDALINYISTLGWPEEGKNVETHWPGVQVAGKDNLRQQSAMWQSMLMSAGVEPSKQVYIHGFITANGKKISKSLGNTVDPIEVVQKYGADTLRYYLLREIPSGSDGDFSEDRLVERYNTELGNDLGNLLQRSLTMAEKFTDGVVPAPCSNQLPDKDVWKKYQSSVETFELHQALETTWELVRWLNSLIDEKRPWELAKAGKQEELDEVIYTLLETLRMISWMLQPFLPMTSQRMLASLGYEETAILEPILDTAQTWGTLPQGQVLVKGEPLFPKIERKEV